MLSASSAETLRNTPAAEEKGQLQFFFAYRSLAFAGSRVCGHTTCTMQVLSVCTNQLQATIYWEVVDGWGW